jgi:hypothetical protein
MDKEKPVIALFLIFIFVLMLFSFTSIAHILHEVAIDPLTKTSLITLMDSIFGWLWDVLMLGDLVAAIVVLVV